MFKLITDAMKKVGWGAPPGAAATDHADPGEPSSAATEAAAADAGGTRDVASAGRGFSEAALAARGAGQELPDRPPGTDGTRRPNHVTQEEYDHICQLNASIQTGDSNLKLDTSRVEDDEAAHFQRRVMSDLGDILQTPNGRELIEKLAAAKGADGTARTSTLSAMPPPPIGTRVLDNEQPWIGPMEHLEGSAPARRRRHRHEALVRPHPRAREHPRVGPAEPRGSSGGGSGDIELFRQLVHMLHGVQGTMQGGQLAPGELTAGDRGSNVHRQTYAEIGLGPFAQGPRSQLTENGYRKTRAQVPRPTYPGAYDDELPRFDARPKR